MPFSSFGFWRSEDWKSLILSRYVLGLCVGAGGEEWLVLTGAAFSGSDGSVGVLTPGVDEGVPRWCLV